VQVPTDELLLEEVRKGNTEAFAALYRRYRAPLFAFCSRLTGNREHAEDAVHESFLALSRSADSIRSPGAFRTWLFRVARNESLMILRQNKRTVPLPEEEIGSPWEQETPLTLLEARDGAARIEYALLRLKPEYREVLLLREFEDLSYAEIAEITGSTGSAVKARIFKARKALAERLGV
jgi:RNA polymerase sigma-70 factor (ECF subfamily)